MDGSEDPVVSFTCVEHPAHPIIMEAHKSAEMTFELFIKLILFLCYYPPTDSITKGAGIQFIIFDVYPKIATLCATYYAQRGRVLTFF